MLPIGKIRENTIGGKGFRVARHGVRAVEIVNLESNGMRHRGGGVPDVGGIPEVVDDGVTGSLVHYDADDAAGYQAGIAKAVNALIADPEEERSAMAERGGSAASRSSPLGADRTADAGDLPEGVRLTV